MGKILHPIGLAFTSLVLIVFIVLACIDLNHVNRITIRLIGAIALGDFINHLAELISIGTKDLVGTPYCVGLTAFRTFGRLFYGLTNLAICFHLYRAIVKLKKSTWKFELAIWLTMMFAIGLIMLAFHFLGMFTGKNGKRACVFGSDNRLFTRISMGFMGFFYLSIISTCVYVTIIGRRSLTHWINSYANYQINREEAQRKFKVDRRKMAERSFLYPLSTLITISTETIISISNAAAYPIPDLLFFMVIGNGLAGILTAIAFAIDPAVWKSVQIARIQVLNWYNGIKNTKRESIQMNFVDNPVLESPPKVLL